MKCADWTGAEVILYRVYVSSRGARKIHFCCRVIPSESCATFPLLPRRVHLTIATPREGQVGRFRTANRLAYKRVINFRECFGPLIKAINKNVMDRDMRDR